MSRSKTSDSRLLDGVEISPHPATHLGPTRNARRRAIAADLQVLIVASFVAASVISPTWVVRGGVILPLVVLTAQIGRWRTSAADWAATALAVLVALSTLWAQFGEQAFISSAIALSWLALFLSIRSCIRRPRDLRIVIYGLWVGSVVALVLIWIQNGGVTFRLTYDELDTRLGAKGLNFNYLAYVFATAAIFIVVLWQVRTQSGSGPRRPVLIALGLLMYVGVLLGGTRGAILSLAALVVWIIVSRLASRLAFRVMLLAAIAASVALTMGFLDSWLRENSGSSSRERGDLNGRLELWPAARQAFSERPVFGWGAGTFQDLPTNRMQAAAHNVFLDLGTGLGLVGIVVFLAAVSLSLRRGLQARTPPFASVSVGAFIVASLPILLTGYWHESLIFWSALAIISKLEVLEAPTDLAFHEEVGDIRC